MTTFIVCWWLFVMVMCLAFYNEYLESGNDLYQTFACAGMLSIFVSIILLLAG